MTRNKVANHLLGTPRSYTFELVGCNGPLQVVQVSRRPQPESRVCPHCGCMRRRSHRRTLHRIFHVPMDRPSCALRLGERCGLCPDRSRNHYEPDRINGTLSPHISAELDTIVAVELVRLQSVYSISRRLGADEDMRPADLDEHDAKRVARGRESPGKEVARALPLDHDLTLAHVRLMALCEWSDTGGSRRKLGNWTGVSQDCGVPELGSATRTMKKHRERILRGYRLDETSAVPEGINSAVKALKHICFGFSRFERMSKRYLLVLGCTRLVEEPPGLNNIPKAKRNGAGRERQIPTPAIRRRTEKRNRNASGERHGGTRPETSPEMPIVGDSHKH